MLTAENIQTMKRNNVSVNGNLTMQRTKEALKSASRKQKNDIDALAGLKRVSINRVSATGSISTKIAIAIGQTLNISPYYLTGESGKPGECTNEVLNSFLADKGYADLIDKPVKPARRRRVKATIGTELPLSPAVEQPIPVESVESPEQDTVRIEPAQEISENCLQSLIELTEEEGVYLLRSLFIQAKYSSNAIGILGQIKALLV